MSASKAFQNEDHYYVCRVDITSELRRVLLQQKGIASVLSKLTGKTFADVMHDIVDLIAHTWPQRLSFVLSWISWIDTMDCGMP